MFFSDLSNEAHSKTNQFTSKKIKSDTVLNEVHKNIKKQANEMKGNVWRKTFLYVSVNIL